MLIGATKDGGLALLTYFPPKRSRRSSSSREAGRRNLLEAEDAQRSVGLVARVVRHPLPPEVVGEDAAEARTGSDVRVVDYRPHVVVHQLPVQRVAVAQGAQGGQRGVASRGGSDIQPRTPPPPPEPLLAAALLLLRRPLQRRHGGPGFSRGSAGRRVRVSEPSGTSIPPGR